MKLGKFKIRTRWGFKIFNKKKFKNERVLTIKNIENFYEKWEDIDFKNIKNLFLYIKYYEKLISTPPGIFDKEYLYYFLKSLLNINDKKINKKLEEIGKLRETYFKKIYFFDSLKNSTKKEKNKIINSYLLRDYREFFKKIFNDKAIAYFKPTRNSNLFSVRLKLMNEIIKLKEKFSRKNS